MTRLEGTLEVEVVSTQPFDGQKPGTSGLRKRTREFMKPHFLQNFVQATFNALGDGLTGAAMVVSGDGRFWNDVAIQVIIKMAAANGVRHLIVGQHGLLSTPAVSCVIRRRSPKPMGGFILSASHNPGGIDNDFGIKYNIENGGPAPESITSQIHEHTTRLTEYKICSFPDVPLAEVACYTIDDLTIEVIDSTEDHVQVLKECFDFDELRAFVKRPDFSLVYDAMHGVNGPYARRIFVEELGLSPECLMNCVPSPEFGGSDSASGGHADPNLVYAKELVGVMGLTATGEKTASTKPVVPVFGAAADGDADRNMILGSHCFVSPSDSLAIIAANAHVIPFFKRNGGLKAVARSMPTSSSLDVVAKRLGIECFEVPTGWKFFGNLMDSGSDRFPGTKSYTPFLCGEESFGTGSSHAREKDGMWATLAWLQMLAARNTPGEKLVTVRDLLEEHWKLSGRHYYGRYDFEVEKAGADAMMKHLAGATVEGVKIDEFNYEDCVDGSVTTKQGMRLFFADGNRAVFRLSGTGVAGATVRLYLEKYAPTGQSHDEHVFDVLKPIADQAMAIAKLKEFTGKDKPDVIT